MGKRLGALFLALPLSCAAMFGPRIEFASAGTQSYSDRATFSGAVYLGGDSIAAESQQLTLHVGEIPADAGDEYDDSYMTSELTFYNAGEEDATLRLAYPCPAMPKDVSAREYRLSLDGEAIEPQVCHSYAGYFNRTINVEDVLDGAAMRSPDFYRADLPATEYKFRTDLSQVTLTDAEKKHLALVLTFDCDQSATRIISCNVMNFEVINGRLRLAFDLKGGEEIVGVTVAGKDIANLSYGVYTDLARTEAVATHIYCGRSETTFGSFAASFYPEGCEVSRADWARGLAQMLVSTTAENCVVYGRPCNLRPEAFLKWYVYSVTVPAGARAVHTVSAPLYPVTSNGRYQYDILLSPLACWSLPNFRVSLETPYYLAYSNLNFEKAGEVYTFSRDRLPLGELSFTLAPSAGTSPIGNSYDPISPSLRLAFVLLGVLGGVAAIGAAVAIIVAVRKKKRR